jgi:hypothetical protein
MEYERVTVFARTCLLRRRTVSTANTLASTSDEVLGSGIGETPVLILIVSTKKSHPFSAASGVVIVTDVIGCAVVERREKSPNPLAEKSGAMPVNVLLSTRDEPENALTT